jgi:hypothetical protein
VAPVQPVDASSIGSPSEAWLALSAGTKYFHVI